MKIKVDFLNPSEISINPDSPDLIILTFKYPSNFSDFLPTFFAQSKTFTLSSLLPEQATPFSKTFSAAYSFADTSLRAILPSNFFLAAILKFSMNQLSRAIYTIQIINFTPMLNVTLPSNYLDSLKEIVDIINLNLIPKESVVKFVNKNLR